MLDCLNSAYDPAKLNSCVVNKYEGRGSFIPAHSDDERCIDPHSSIFTVSLGGNVI